MRECISERNAELRQKTERLLVIGEVLGLKADIVVDCTGNPSGFQMAKQLVRPRGTIVVKSTFHGASQSALTPMVVNEVTIVGSRCGPFAAALRLLERGLVEVRPLTSAVYPLDEGLAAFERAKAKGTLKVLLRM